MVPASASVGPNAVIEAGVVLGEGAAVVELRVVTGWGAVGELRVVRPGTSRSCTMCMPSS